MKPGLRVGRLQALTVRCPSCSARPGVGCTGVHGRLRQSPHLDRYRAAQRVVRAIRKGRRDA